METLFDDEDLDYVGSVSKSVGKDPKSEWVERSPGKVASMINEKTDERAVAQVVNRGEEILDRSVFVFINEEEDLSEEPSIDNADFVWKASSDANIENLLHLFQNGGESEYAKVLNDIWNTRP